MLSTFHHPRPTVRLLIVASHPVISRSAVGAVVPTPTLPHTNQIFEPTLDQFTLQNIGLPDVLNQSIASQAGADCDQYRLPISARRDVHDFVPKLPDVSEKPVITYPEEHGHVIRSKYVPKSPSAAEAISEDVEKRAIPR